MKFVIIDVKYLNYLRQYEKHIYYKNIKIAEIKINNMIPILDNSLIKEYDYKINSLDSDEEKKYKI